jgi:predicted Zn-dependent protease with MMP-like domain
MIEMGDEQFASLIEEVMEELPKEHMIAVKNVAITYADDPTEKQRQELKLACDDILFGLYEGVPLIKRNGQTHFPPDKITIFKHPALQYAQSYEQLRRAVKHTLWHEIAHYFGLSHAQIHKLEQK